MMMFIGLILLVIYAVGMIKGGYFIETIKEGRNVKEYAESEDFKKMTQEEQTEYSLKLLIKTFSALVFSIIASFLTICFLIGAIGVDIILVPTILLLALMVIKAVRVIVSKEYREKIGQRELGGTRAKVSSGVYFFYVLYILILIVL